jgi:tetratricopeptide (TPR) repeat protein
MTVWSSAPVARFGGGLEQHLMLARVLAAEGRYHEALQRCENALSLNEAKAELWQAIEHDPDDVSAHIELGALLLRDDQVREATSEFHKASAAARVSVLATIGLAECYHVEGNEKGAENELRYNMRVRPYDCRDCRRCRSSARTYVPLRANGQLKQCGSCSPQRQAAASGWALACWYSDSGASVPVQRCVSSSGRCGR